MENLVWGKMINASLAKSEEEKTTKQTTTIHKVVTKAPQLPAPAEKAIITHEDEKICCHSSSHWWLYGMVHVSMNRKFVYHWYTRCHAIPDIVYIPIN